MRQQQQTYVTIGRIQKVHGIKGEVKVKPFTDIPERFEQLNSVFIERNQSSLDELDILKASVKNQSVYLIFKGIDTRNKAQNLIGAFINIEREDVRPLDEGCFYHFEIIGFEVQTTSGENLGRVEEVMELPANDVFVIRKNKQECLIPIIKDVVLKIDKEAEKIVIQPIEGLID